MPSIAPAMSITTAQVPPVIEKTFSHEMDWMCVRAALEQLGGLDSPIFEGHSFVYLREREGLLGFERAEGLPFCFLDSLQFFFSLLRFANDMIGLL